jgi:hypothetical protein
MKPNGSAPETAARYSGFRRFLRAFNHWRKRYVGLRLLYLLFLGFCVFREAFLPVLPNLVRIAIQAMQSYSDPRLVTALARSRRARMARRLQFSLWHVADKDANGSLEGTELDLLWTAGLDPEELRTKPIQANLPRLFDACHRLGLLPSSYTFSSSLREARLAATAEVERIQSPLRLRIEPMLKTWEEPDYLQLKTWKRGGVRFVQYLWSSLWWFGRPRTVLVWFPFCFFVSLLVTAPLRRGKSPVGFLLGFALSAPIIVWSVRSSYGFFPEFMRTVLYSYIIFEGAAFLCLTMAVAASAARLGEGRRNRRLLASVAAMGLGAVLLIWGLPRWISGQALSPPTVNVEMFLGGIAVDWLFCIAIPFWVKDVSGCLGAVCFVIGGLGLARARGFQATRKSGLSTDVLENGQP